MTPTGAILDSSRPTNKVGKVEIPLTATASMLSRVSVAMSRVIPVVHTEGYSDPKVLYTSQSKATVAKVRCERLKSGGAKNFQIVKSYSTSAPNLSSVMFCVGETEA